MCGIAGYFGNREIEPARLHACLELMHHRGPDGGAVRRFTFPPAGAPGPAHNAYLLHTRLRIIDLDPRADQPFQVGSKWMVYNGELYNYRELGAELERAGHELRTSSDTEVLLHRIDRDGPAALDRCEGMWALAVYDQADGSLLLARDRFGEKPLYLLRQGGGLYFGSEVKFIHALLGHRLAVDPDHLRRYLVNGYKALYKQPAGFFRGMGELGAATWLRVDAAGGESEGRYWRPGFAPDEAMSYDDAVAGTRERLLRAVELRLRADVPLAFCMSGGVDSNALIAIAKRSLGHDVHGFTIVSADARYDESELVTAAVADLGLRHTVVATDTRDFLARLRQLVHQHDAPVYTITYYAHWLLMQAVAASGYRVSVSGTAADELFSGYYDHHLAYLYEVRGDPACHAAALAAWDEHVRPLVRNPFLSDPDRFVDDPAFRAHIYLDAEEFSRYLVEPWLEPFTERSYAPSLLRNRMLNELFHEAVPVILHEDDLNSMYFSIENRSPFLDRPLFEFACRIPTRHLVRDGYAKAVLRDAVAGIVPEAVRASRRKVGFNASIHDFLDPAAPEVRAEVLAPSPVWDLVRKDRIAALLARRPLPNSESKFLFYFLCCKMFLEELG